jgi:hypothetical protein
MAAHQFVGDRTNLLPYDDDTPATSNPTTPSSYLNSANGFGAPQSKDAASQESDVGGPKQEKAPAPDRGDPEWSADGSTVLSDADPEPWIPGAQYAQYSTRRGGGGGLQWRELSPVEGIRVMLYDSAFRTLKELEPNHPQLQSMSTSTWVPTFNDTSRLNEAIARIKAGRGLSELEPHHNFPLQFAHQFRACRIEPEDYLTFLLERAVE